ncbi:MAG: hypothetical protein ACR2QE_08810 [Acidimicrobiales bacterium]
MKLAAYVCVVALVAAGCASDSDGEANGGNQATTTTGTATTPPPTPATSTTTTGSSTTVEAIAAVPAGPIAFNGQGNDLVAYDDTGASQRVITNAGDDPEGRDINGQVCFLDDRHFVAGEDTNQPDPPAGFGIFSLEGSGVGDLIAAQVGKLTPTYQDDDAAPEPYGCGVLPDGRLVTTDIGNQASGPESGQLIVWFPPIAGSETEFCKVDTTIGTAGQVAIDGDDVLVASARGATAGVQRYRDLPTGPTAADGCDGEDSDGSPMVTAADRSLFIDPADGNLGLANGITASDDGWFVSSVIGGLINEYDQAGQFVRTVLEPADDDTLDETPFLTGTPLGIAYDNGVLWYADIGVVITPDNIGPGDRTGTVRLIRFTDDEPGEPEIIDEGLAFPDAIGIGP